MEWQESSIGKSVDAKVAELKFPNTAVFLTRGENYDADFAVLKAFQKKKFRMGVDSWVINEKAVDLIGNYLFIFYLEYDDKTKNKFEKETAKLFKGKLNSFYSRLYQGTTAISHEEKSESRKPDK